MAKDYKYVPTERLETSGQPAEYNPISTAGLVPTKQMVFGATHFVRLFMVDPAIERNPVVSLKQFLAEAKIVNVPYTSRSAAHIKELMQQSKDTRTVGFQFMQTRPMSLTQRFGLGAMCERLGLIRMQERAESDLYLIAQNAYSDPDTQKAQVMLFDAQVIQLPQTGVVVLGEDMRQLYPSEQGGFARSAPVNDMACTHSGS